jgi:hypothetical protein
MIEAADLRTLGARLEELADLATGAGGGDSDRAAETVLLVWRELQELAAWRAGDMDPRRQKSIARGRPR